MPFCKKCKVQYHKEHGNNKCYKCKQSNISYGDVEFSDEDLNNLHKSFDDSIKNKKLHFRKITDEEYRNLIDIHKNKKI